MKESVLFSAHPMNSGYRDNNFFLKRCFLFFLSDEFLKFDNVGVLVQIVVISLMSVLSYVASLMDMKDSFFKCPVLR